MAKALKNVEIFAVGTWKGSKEINVTSEDLDAMVQSFNDLSLPTTGYKPMLKLGHQDQQRYFGQKTGAPSLGFVERVWREGDKLLADFANVPDALLALVEQGRYNTLSIEFYPSVEHAGRTFKNVLTAVALLGAELPAVKGLKELALSLFTEKAAPWMGAEGLIESHKDKQESKAVFTQEQVDSLIAAALVSERAKFDAEKAAAVSAAKAESSTALAEAASKVTAAETRATTAERALIDFEAATTDKEIVGLVDGAIKEGRILPKDKDQFVAIGKSMTAKVKLGDKEVSGQDAFKDMLSKMAKQVNLSARTAKDETRSAENQDANPGIEVDTQTRAKMAADPTGKLDYATARKLVLNADPDLKERYAAMAVG